MAHENARYEFTQEEYEKIRELTRQKLAASPEKQKGIRGKLRRMGFYWEDYNPKRTSFNLETLEQLFINGILKIKGKTVNPVISKQEHSNEPIQNSVLTRQKENKVRENSDEAYVIDLCDEVLGLKASRQHRFEFLKGDTGIPLPVDAYYKDLDLVIEYYERQHTEEVKFFDKRMTASGVTRGEQRKIYDERRKEILPKHGIKLIVISYTEFGESKKLKRNRQNDLMIVKKILKDTNF